MSLQYPLRHVFITQAWGVNGHIYSRFGFKGHNGVDYRLFDEQGQRAATALLYSPHDGKVIEARYDADGYGNYLKIESSSQGSILAHLKSYSVKVGDTVSQGQLIGVCDNTGWSTGAHLHWGYYTLPRNRANGYGGTIDQEKLSIKKLGEDMSETPLEVCMRDRKKFWEERDAALEELKLVKENATTQQTVLKQEIAALKEKLAKEIQAHKETATELGECRKTDPKIRINEEVEVAGKTWVINGVEVNSLGVVTANYEEKK